MHATRRRLGWGLAARFTVIGVGAVILASAPLGRPQAAAGGFLRAVAAPKTVSVAELVARGPASVAGGRVSRLPEIDHRLRAPFAAIAPAASQLGGSTAPASPVVNGDGGGSGFPGIDLVAQANAGTGQYKGANGGLEPPDQALCVGSGFVIEGVNNAMQVYTSRAVPLTPPIPLVQFFQLLPSPGLSPGMGSFTTDVRCIYDAASKRFFLSSLEEDTVNAGGVPEFTRSHNYFAVSKTSDPTGDWYIYSFDVTDDGTNGTPMHATCPCLGDQPLIGADAHGFYLSDNEFSNSEVLPAAPPPATGKLVNTVFSLPDFRSGQAQVYALSKQRLINGQMGPLVQFDSVDTPLPAADASTAGALWSSLQPAHSPPGDQSSAPAGGAEFFMSQLDFAMAGDNRIAVWALTNTASLTTATPSLSLKNTVITTLNPADTYTFAVSADQKAGTLSLGANCQPVACNEEKLNANDDRMNEVMLTDGSLWGGVNTRLPPINAAGTGTDADPRTGIMYFEVRPSLVGGNLSAVMARDGYVVVPRENVLFPSIGASPSGPVVMSFTLSGVDYFPSAVWTELDGLAPGAAPTVHISALGAAAEDGFTGYCAQGIVADPLGQCSNGVARWGDYSFSEVDEQGCIWSGVEYISGGPALSGAGNWATFVNRVAPAGCVEPALTPKPRVNIAPCLPLFTNPAGSDNYLQMKGANPQMSIIKGEMKLSADGKNLVTTMTLANLSKTIAQPGQENRYYMVWTFGSNQYYSRVGVDNSGTVVFADGQITGNTYGDRTSGPADTGSFNPGPNGTVVVNVPLNQVGSPKPGELLLQPNGQTKELIGILLEPVDSTTPQYDYQLGQTCVAAVQSPPPSPRPPVVGGRLPLPNSAGDGHALLPGAMPAAPALLLLGLTGWSRRRRRRRSDT